MNEIKTVARFMHQHAFLLRDLALDMDGPGVEDGLMRFMVDIGYQNKMADVPGSLRVCSALNDHCA